MGRRAGDEFASSRGLQLTLDPEASLIFVVTSACRPPGLPFVSQSTPALLARVFQAGAVRVQIPRLLYADQSLMSTLHASDAIEMASSIG